MKRKGGGMFMQQGDVLLFRAAALPEKCSAVRPVGGRLVLAEGEATGHAHAIAAAPDVELWQDSAGTLWCSAGKPVTVSHEEHKPVTLPAGVWRVGRVREVDPFQGEIREVAD